MNINWIVLAVGIAGAIVMLSTPRLRRDRRVSLGTLRHQWKADQRLSQGQDPQR